LGRMPAVRDGRPVLALGYGPDRRLVRGDGGLNG